MPSGAKKRKAAKKKKVQQTNNNNKSANFAVNSNVGGEEVKQLDEKDGDGGEVSSPTSQDTRNSEPFAEGEEENGQKGEDSASVQSLVSDKNSVDEVNYSENVQKGGIEEENVVYNEGELKLEDFKSKDISIIESLKEEKHGGLSGSSSSSDSSSSSSSSSDDESCASSIERKTTVVETSPAVDSVKPGESLLEVVTEVKDSTIIGVSDNESVETGPIVGSVELADCLSEVVNQVIESIPGGEINGYVDTVPAVDIVKPVDSLSEKVNQVIDSISDGVVETVCAADCVKPDESLWEVVDVIDSIPGGETNVVVQTVPAVDNLVEPVDYLSEVVNEVTHTIPVDEPDNLDVETVPALELVKQIDYLPDVTSQVSNSTAVRATDDEAVETACVVEQDEVKLVERVIQVTEHSATDHYESPCVVELDLQENGEEVLSMLNDNIKLSPVLTDSGSREKEDEVVSTSEEKAAVSLDMEDCVTEVYEEKLVLSYNAPVVQSRNDEEPIKESESPICFVNQPLATSAPRVVQKSSFMSCCGIFDLFTGSDR